jgi:signal peptidase I
MICKCKEVLKDWGAIFIALLVFIILRMFIFDINPVSGHSMDPTYHDGNYVVSSKVFNIKRFDVVIANEYNKPLRKNFKVIKRVIGLPGDTITYKKDTLYVNGVKTEEPYLNEYKQLFYKNKDKLYNEYSYERMYQSILEHAQAFTTNSEIGYENGELSTAGETDFEIKVPENQYLLIGDNRLVSQDSRSVGTFKESQITSKVVWSVN